MYVRWQYRKRQRDGAMHWSATLVENVRHNGKPHQTRLASIGGITKAQASDDAEARYRFWFQALSAFAALKQQRGMNLSDQRKIEAALAARVRRPTKKQIERWRHRELAREFKEVEQIARQIKVSRTDHPHLQRRRAKMTILRTDNDYRKFAKECLAEQGNDRDEAFVHYIDECRTMHIGQPNLSAYVAHVTKLFNEATEKAASRR
jgi:hypothetical protein